MPKRSFDDKMDHYIRKIEKLKEKYSRKRRRLNFFSSSDEENIQEDETAVWNPTEANLGDTVPLPDMEEVTEVLPVLENSQAGAESGSTTTQNEPPPRPASMDTSTPSQLDPEILSALGEATNTGPQWGQEIHDNLTQLWLPLLKKGMDKETRDKIFKQYAIPSNCTLLQAPKLNIEISAAVIEMVRLRDKKVEATQQQLGIGITAVSRAMTSLLTNDNKVEAIRMLSDGCRVLCDLHHTETRARIKMITPGLAKPFLNIIQESERDETLFGVTLPEKIKASKTVEKQGLQIKKPAPQPRSNLTMSSTMVTRQQFQENWSGSPRYPTNRGGRGGQRRAPTTSRRPAPAMSTQTRANQNKSRAPPRP